MKFKSVIILLLTVLITAPFIFADGAAAEKKKAEKCPGRVKVQVEKVVPTLFPEHKVLEKRVLPSRDNEVKNGIAGVIKKVEKPIGSEVKTGDVILTMDTAKIEAEITGAEAELKKWKRILFKREHWKVRSERAEKQAKGNRDAAQVVLDNAREKLALGTITSPADGKVGTLNANEGDHISEGFVVGNVVDVQQVKVALSTHADKVTDGQKIKIRLKELSKTVKGTVQKNDEGTFIFMDNPEGKILVGMTAKFKVLFKEHKDVVVIAKEKILKDDGGAFVYTVGPDPKRAAKNYLKAGPKEAGKWLILEGLEVGDEIIVAEILSAKAGTLKEELLCLRDNKKIKVLVKDPESGKFVKSKVLRKKKVKKETVKKETVKEEKIKEEKKKEEVVEKKVKKKKIKKQKPVARDRASEREWFGKARIGISVSYYRMLDTVFETVYGRLVGFGLDLSYMVTDKMDIWVTGAISSRKAEIDWAADPLEFKFTPISLDLRYFFKRSDKWDFFAGGGLNLYPFEDINPIENVKDNAFGFNAVAGAYYHIAGRLSMHMILRFNLVKKAIENADNDLNMNSAELLFGLSYNL